MTKNPLLNALAAALYIVAVAAILFYGPRAIGSVNSVIVPIALISLFTLSAAVMGYIFLSRPAELYFDGKKKEALRLFLSTVLFFGLITLVAFLILVLAAS